MLSDEEREALQYFNTETKTEAMHYGAVLVKLIEKKSKEIEELKERYERANKRYLKSLQEKDDKCEKLLEYVETEKETEYISKDKIKAKIEELDEEIKVKREIAKNPMDRVSGRLLIDSIVELEKTKKVLQSLLEKE